MKDGYRVYDTDTHIDPGADVLEKYVDPAFRARLDDLAPYRATVKSRTVDGPRYVYEPALAREQMGRRAIGTLLTTFYGNSVEKVVAAMLDQEDIAPDTLDRLASLIEKARKEGR